MCCDLSIIQNHALDAVTRNIAGKSHSKQVNFETYPILKLSPSPATMDIQIISAALTSSASPIVIISSTSVQLASTPHIHLQLISVMVEKQRA